MADLHEQLRRYGARLDTLDAPAPVRARVERIPLRRRIVGLLAGPRLAWSLTAVAVLVVAAAVLSTGAERPARQATRGDAPVAADRSAPAAAERAPTSASGSAESLTLAPPDGAPDAATRTAVDQQLASDASTCRSVAAMKERAREVTSSLTGRALGVRVVVGSTGPCARVARIDWSEGIVHLERFRSAP